MYLQLHFQYNTSSKVHCLTKAVFEGIVDRGRLAVVAVVMADACLRILRPGDRYKPDLNRTLVTVTHTRCA